MKLNYDDPLYKEIKNFLLNVPEVANLYNNGFLEIFKTRSQLDNTKEDLFILLQLDNCTLNSSLSESIEEFKYTLQGRGYNNIYFHMSTCEDISMESNYQPIQNLYPNNRFILLGQNTIFVDLEAMNDNNFVNVIKYKMYDDKGRRYSLIIRYISKLLITDLKRYYEEKGRYSNGIADKSTIG